MASRTDVRRAVCVVTEEGSGGASLEAAPLDPSRGGAGALDAAGAVATGDLVLADPTSTGWAAIGKPLARAGSLRAELVRLAVEAGVDPTYPPEVMAEARRWAGATRVDDPDLVDLRDLPFVTIDNVGSRDLDQALLVERDGDGFLVRYALADASFYVRPESALLADALERGASFYLPGWAVPMLPPMLSEGVISLNSRVDRRALVFEVRLAPDGSVRRTEVVRARIRSRRKLSYRRVQRAWDEPAGSGFRGEAFAPSLELLREVGVLRVAEARRRHAVSFHRHEVEVELDGERAGFRVLARERLEVERCGEQLSLLVNVEGARMLLAAGGGHVQPVFRVHPAPTDERLDRLAAQIGAVVRRHGLDPGRWRWRRDQPLADYLEGLPVRGAHRFLAAAIERQALLTNERSEFGTRPGPHFGVGAPVYARFSSPMREVVGVFTHKEALELLGREPAAPDRADLELRDRVVDAANRARDLQRRLTSEAGRRVLDRLFEPHLTRPLAERPVMRGTVLGLRPGRLYVLLDDPPVEVKVEVGALEEVLGVPLRTDSLDVELTTVGGTDVAALGDRVRVRVLRRDGDRGRWDLEIVGPPASG